MVVVLTSGRFCDLVSLCLLLGDGKLEGVREGSIIAAVLVGTIIKGFNKLFDALSHCKSVSGDS